MSGARTGAKNDEQKLAREFAEAKLQIMLWEERMKALRAQLIAGGRRSIRIGPCIVQVARRQGTWFSWAKARDILSKSIYDACCIRRDVDVVTAFRVKLASGIAKAPVVIAHDESAFLDFFKEEIEDDPFGWPDVDL